jgi:hypothetical protein
MSPSKHPEILWAQRSSETAKEKVINLSIIRHLGARVHLLPSSVCYMSFLRCVFNCRNQNVLFVTINLPDIVESSLQYDLKPASLSFKAQAGYATVPPSQAHPHSLPRVITFRTAEPSTYEFNIDLYKEVIPEVLVLLSIIT